MSPTNKRMHSDSPTDYANVLAAEAKRYVGLVFPGDTRARTPIEFLVWTTPTPLGNMENYLKCCRISHETWVSWLFFSARACSNDEYEILRASLLIRSLLIDGSKSLVDHVNRELRLKLRFSFTDTTTGYSAMVLGMNPTTWSIQDGFDPETAISAHEITEGSRDNLLSAIVLVHGGKRYSVKDVVLQVANITGGVHKGTSKSPKERALSELSLWFGGIPIAINQLKAISRVIIRGLEPLEQAISTDSNEQDNGTEA